MYEIVRLRFESDRPVEESTLRPIVKVLELAKHVQYEIMRTPRQYIGYIDVKSHDGYTVSHSLSVAILALLLGLDMNFDKQKQTDLFLRSLFHDVGMNCVNEKIIMKNGKLNMEEFMKIKEHPSIGNEMFKGFSFATAHLRNIILTHHEKMDGSGYPNQLTGNLIQPLARMVAVIDTFDAMTSDRVYSRAVSPFGAIQHMSALAGKHYDAELMEMFFKRIQPYPEGALVTLTNGMPALVYQVPEEDPLRPIVLPIDRATRKLSGTPFPLAENPDIQISGILYDISQIGA